MLRDRILMAVACGVLGASVLAQAVPLCCRYNYSWPPEGDGPDGACSGDFAKVCEEAFPDSPGSEDPLSMVRYGAGLRWAQCCIIDIGEAGYFVRSDCDGPPVIGAERVGQLPDGTCCWAVNPAGPIIWDCYDRAFKVKKCETDCPEVPA